MNTFLSVVSTTIPYIKQLRPIAGSVTAAILMQQLDYWFAQYPDGLYKFMKPAKGHSWYREGDSWTEELGFSEDEFRTAFDKIGVRYVSKKRYDAAAKEGDVFEGKFYCSYHDKIRGLTFYFRNHEVTDEAISQLAKCISAPKKAKPPVNGQSPFTEMEPPQTPISVNGQSQSTEIGNLHLRNSETPISVNGQSPVQSISENTSEINPEITSERKKEEEEESLTRSRVLETTIEVKPQNNEVSQMELATLSSDQDPDRSEQKTSSEDQSSAAPKKPQKEKKAKSKADCDPERFDRWWKGYIRLCKELGANSGNRIDAIAEWNALLKDGANPDDIDFGTLLFADEKRAEKAEKGKAFGVKNGCRFLSKKEWNDAIERADIDASTAIVDVEIVEESEPVNSSAISPATQHPNKVAGFDARFTQKSEAFLRWQELFKIEFMQLDLKRTPGNFDKAWQKWNERGLESQSLADICEGTALYFETQRNQLKTKGECYCLGAVNFLENEAWEISLRQRQIQQQFPVQKKVSPKTATDEERYESLRQEAIRRGLVNV